MTVILKGVGVQVGRRVLIIGIRGAACLHLLLTINNATIAETDVLTYWQAYLAESQMAFQCQITLKFND